MEILNVTPIEGNHQDSNVKVLKEDLLALINNVNNEEQIREMYLYLIRLNKAHTVVYNNNDNQNVNIQKAQKVKKEVNTSSDQYRIALKFVNKILENIGKPIIINLRDFKNIDREDIIKDVNKKTLSEMEKYIFEHFDKKKCGYYRQTDNIVLNCLRGMMKTIGLELISLQKTKTVKCMTSTHYYYSIQ